MFKLRVCGCRMNKVSQSKQPNYKEVAEIMICDKQTVMFLQNPTLNLIITGKKEAQRLPVTKLGTYYFLQWSKEQTNQPKASVFREPGSEPVSL